MIRDSRHWIAVASGLVVLAGLALRLYQIDAKSLWSDELYTTAIALYRDAFGTDQYQRFRRTSMNGVEDADTFWTIKASDQSPPLFDLVVKGAVHVFDSIELALRMPSVLFGSALLMYLAYLAWRSLDSGQRSVYVLVLAMTAFSAAAIQYSQEARSYSLGLLFSAVLTARLYSRLNEGIAFAPLPRWPEIVVFILACHTHYNLIAFSAVLLSIYGLVGLVRGDLSSLLRLAVVPLACLPWLALARHTILYTSRGGVAWAETMTPLEALRLSLDSIVKLAGGAFMVIAAVFIGLWIARAAFAKIAPVRRRATVTMVALLAFTLANVAIVAVMAFKTGLFNPRYFVFALPPLYFGIAVGIAELAGARPLWVGVAAAMLAFTQVDPIRAHFAEPKENYRDAAAWLQPAIGPGGLVFTTWNKAYYRVYLERFGKDPQIINFTQAVEAPGVCERGRGVQRVAVFAHATHSALVEALVASCGHDFRREEKRFHGIIAQRWAR